jgi:hypothetical protein
LRKAAARLSKAVSKAGVITEEARRPQTILWRSLLEDGVPQAAIAKESGVTPMAVHARLNGAKR